MSVMTAIATPETGVTITPTVNDRAVLTLTGQGERSNWTLIDAAILTREEIVALNTATTSYLLNNAESGSEFKAGI